MKLYKRLFLPLIFGFWSLGASQQIIAQTLRNPAADLYHVVALRVEFQPDTTRFTTGDGTFSDKLWKGLVPKIDPLPHDAGYFQAHLTFLENYIARVSDGKTSLKTHLIPEIVRVSKQMGAYAPTGKTSDSEAERQKLAALVKEAWQLADVQSSFDITGMDPKRTLFLLFHAGAGRDIELVGTTLLKTPEDLPSLFFNQPALDKLTGGNIRFKGFEVNHTAILPETETRLGYDSFAQKNFLVEVSINGLLAASFLNYLGVPDLFDTVTGKTAIGSFCVMDGEGIFAYNGLFPPEPSAWVKYYVGWTEPRLLLPEYAKPQEVVLEQAGAATTSDVIKIPLSHTEYYLVENRQRDAEGDGIRLQIRRPDGQVITQVFTNHDQTFTRTDQSGISSGTVVGVDNYDWALPGGVDRAGHDRMGGILVWHIDETVLRAKLADNRVNVDAQQRGVDLEEADGAQDIGVASFPCSDEGDNNILRGSYDDFWFLNNPVNCVIDAAAKPIGQYRNELGPSTFPNTNTNSGAKTGVQLFDFSATGAQMGFKVSRKKVPTYLENRILPNSVSLKTTQLTSAPVKAMLNGQTWTLTPQMDTKRYTWMKDNSTGKTFDPAQYLSGTTTINGFPILTNIGPQESLVALTTVDKYLLGFNTEGAMAEGFPIVLPSSSIHQPLVIRFKAQQKGTVIIAGTDGNLYGFDLDRGGKPHPDFPLAAGGTFSHHPKADLEGIYIKNGTTDGQFWRWDTGYISSILWGELFYDAQNSNTITLTSMSLPAFEELLISKETYNWPNPVRKGTTHLRLACTETCDVSILITDLAGQKIAVFDLKNIPAQIPYETNWSASVPNGVYLAKVKASSTNRTEYKIIQIAVVKQ
ncbi:MAG: hypothetical protein JNN12_10945 [Bacteroidetes Order II. Incertae sedis bacterium]|nr:hypothetical protein [Bacteroidetes Order II. bacterium]